MKHRIQAWFVRGICHQRWFLILGLVACAGVCPEALIATAAAAEKPGPTIRVGEETNNNLVRGEWLKDSRFAMFIHWGLYSELGGRWNDKTYYGIAEWIMNRAQIPAAEYEQVAGRFNPTGFEAREWVKLAKDAGMRHIMITSKHHDGFAMFKSAASPYNIVDATPFRRDPLKELADACQAEGLRFGFYYSQTQDWHERDAVGNTWDWPNEGRDFQKYLQTKAIPQIEELLHGYGPLAGIWFDTPGPITPAESKMLVDLVHQHQPQCLVNSRIGNNLGDYDTLGDQEIPRLPRPGLWETPDTHNDTWAYAGYDHNWKSPREIAERLVRVVSRGGTYMLNVGPDGTGRIPEQSARILREVGQWVARTRNRDPRRRPNAVRATRLGRMHDARQYAVPACVQVARRWTPRRSWLADQGEDRTAGWRRGFGRRIGCGSRRDHAATQASRYTHPGCHTGVVGPGGGEPRRVRTQQLPQRIRDRRGRTGRL